jgi:outer membrane biosynthesis protein TonB
MDNEGRLHAPPIHPGMPPPTLSSPKTADNSVFGDLFAPKSTTPQTQVAAAGSNSQQSGGFFGSLFKPKTETQPAATGPQGAALAGLTPQPSAEPRKSQPAKSEAVKTEAPKVEPPKAEQQTAEAPKSKAKPQDKPQQDATATATLPPANGGLIKGAQPVVPTGSFDGRWAGLQ